MAHIGIVGAGLAGAGAAYALRDTDHDVTLVEKSRGVGGRAATRRKHGCRYDHGANYVKDGDDRTVELIRELGADGLVDVEEPVWTFGRDGEIEPSDRQESHKFTWEAGITQFAKRLLAATDAEVRTTVRAASVARDADTGTWTVTDTDGDDHGPFDRLLLTPPAPQTAALLAATAWDGDGGTLGALREAVEAVEFRTIRTLVLHYDFAVDVPWYAVVDVDKEHDVGWLAREECKDGHVPDGESLLVVQMGPEWSLAHYDDPLDEAAATVAGKAADLVGDDRLADPDWADDQGWRYALPDTGLDPSAGAVEAAREAGLHLAGDWVAGEGRAHRALWSGVEAGERIDGSL
ncbi:NAD(P)/FAD-dependent oxidoreductase [Halobaculum lipolyticum]|uniref:NAD(P)/FAD-dependent oxidoreductase n=1 Tax=Halobaculum lipolyticum TaxID=3032001 RepID=A0ABD5WGF1_9EURY|nr:FAD-dependent oxidoreductase [Halobaculum sp. DT31]